MKEGERPEAYGDTNRQDKSLGGVGEKEVSQYGGPGGEHGGSFQAIDECGAVSLWLQQCCSAFSSTRRERECSLFLILCLSILASLSPIESMQVVQFLIRKVSRVSHHLACFSSLRDMTDRVVCPDAVVVLLYMVFACLPSPVHVGLIFASVWVDAVHISQERCVRHMKSQTRYRSVVY